MLLITNKHTVSTSICQEGFPLIFTGNIYGIRPVISLRVRKSAPFYERLTSLLKNDQHIAKL
jgi:hypothetical protein